MRTLDIPTSVTVTGTLYDAIYTSTNGYSSPTWTWYPPNGINSTKPHITVGHEVGDQKDNVSDTLNLQDLQGNPLAFTKDWWFKLHVSVSLDGTNLHMWYQIDVNWQVQFCGNNKKYIPSSKLTAAITHFNRQTTDYRSLAQAFVTAARSQYMATLIQRGSPATTNVGPQTFRSFEDSTGL